MRRKNQMGMNSPMCLIVWALRVALVFMLFCCTGCSLPKIIILHDPLSPQEHINLGVAYEKNGELDNAFTEYKKASKKLDLAYLYMGNIHFQKGEYKKAEACYKETIRKVPLNADAFNNLAWLYYTERTNLAQAAELARKALQLDPSKDAVYRNTLEKIEELLNKPRI